MSTLPAGYSAECEYGFERNGTTCSKMPDLCPMACPVRVLCCCLCCCYVPSVWVEGHACTTFRKLLCPMARCAINASICAPACPLIEGHVAEQ